MSKHAARGGRHQQTPEVKQAKVTYALRSSPALSERVTRVRCVRRCCLFPLSWHVGHVSWVEIYDFARLYVTYV
jgi:hypothetical protein